MPPAIFCFLKAMPPWLWRRSGRTKSGPIAGQLSIMCLPPSAPCCWSARSATAGHRPELVRLRRTKKPGTFVPGRDRTALYLARPFWAARLRSVEFIVQAGADDVVGDVQRARHRRCSARERGAERRVDGDPVCLRQRPQIDEEIFKLRRPAAAKLRFYTGAHGPARPGGGKARAARQKRSGLQRAGKNRRIGGTVERVVILDGCPGNAAGRIPQRIADQRAGTRARGTEACQLFLG